MTEADVALEFCQVCLEWQDAQTSGEGCVITAGSTDGGAARTLDFSNLSAVLEAARQWCDKRGVVMKAGYLSLTGKHYVTWIWNGGQFSYACEALSALPSYIMEGCMDAESRLKRGATFGEVRQWEADRTTASQRN